jgi:hypothetical protein
LAEPAGVGSNPAVGVTKAKKSTAENADRYREKNIKKLCGKKASNPR